MPRVQPGPPCAVCGKSSVAQGLCSTHYKRMKRHGHTKQTRPEDWGLKGVHPLNQAWAWTKRVGRVPRWNDFWLFVEDVGEKPTSNHRLKRRDISSPFGPDNWFWAEPVLDKEIDGDRLVRSAAYQKAWRARNPHRVKHYDLKKMYGISLAEYEKLLADQDGGCAVCGQKDEWFNLAVDHCHGTRKVRGLLCSQCNRGIGLFRDKPDLLERAARYLRFPTRLV
jgi:hypothetical protein